ncbi:MAG: M23 family metallopeptidase [Clostridia bacterium]|nr:M23 family metallopeptidase [Clostridia bacterium]
MKDWSRAEENRKIFGTLCAVAALVILSAMPLYRGLERGFSESYGLGAAMVMLREEIEQNEDVAAFLGVGMENEPVSEVSSVPFDLDAAVAAYIEAHTPQAPEVVLPLDGDLTSPHGVRNNPFADGKLIQLGLVETEEHFGIDIGASRSRCVRAAMAGKVSKIGSDPDGYGNYLVIEHDGCSTLYAHCAEIYVGEGQTVAAGEELALAGRTGRATGIHLHFEVFVDGVSVDPIAYFNFYSSDQAGFS